MRTKAAAWTTDELKYYSRKTDDDELLIFRFVLCAYWKYRECFQAVQAASATGLTAGVTQSLSR